MSPRAILIPSVVLLALGGFAGYEHHVATRQRQQLAELRAQAAQLSAGSAALRLTDEATTRDLAAAETQLAALPAPAAAGTSPERRAMMKAWLVRVKKLRQLFEQRPDQRTPEMRFLTDQDWLKVAQALTLDSEEDIRPALAAVRDAAGARFLPQLVSALRKLQATSPKETPAISALAAFADPPIPPELLERYELLKTTETTPRWRVQAKAPVDADYDIRHHTSAYVDGRGYGTGGEPAPWAWLPGVREQMGRAYSAYAAAHQGSAAPNLTDALPFFNPPLAPDLAARLIQAEERSRNKFDSR